MILALTVPQDSHLRFYLPCICDGVEWPALYNLAVPWSWLLLVPPTEHASKKSEFARVALCLLGAFAALYPLPVAGAQGPFSLMPVIPALCVFLYDGRVMLVRFLPLAEADADGRSCGPGVHADHECVLGPGSGSEIPPAYALVNRGSGADSPSRQGTRQPTKESRPL